MAEAVAHYVHRSAQVGQEVEALCGRAFVLTEVEPVGKPVCDPCTVAMAAWSDHQPVPWQVTGTGRIDPDHRSTLEDYALPV